MLIKSQKNTFQEELIQLIYSYGYPYTIKKYDKKQTIFISQTKCEKIGIILSGKVCIEHLLFNGEINTINILEQYDSFGEILLFTEEHLYPYNIVSYTKCEILFITKEILFKIFKVDMNILEKYLIHISQSYMLLNKYIKLRSQKTIASKFAYYLIHYLKISPDNRQYKVMTKSAMAHLFGVERQSLMRELRKLKELNVIQFSNHDLFIYDYNYLLNLIN